jgi:hypothetical protein
MPEYWVTCRVASALASNGMIVECEKRLADLYYQGDQMIERSLERAGRVDLVIYDPSTEQDRRRPCALIEIKGKNSSWASFPADFIRLRMIATELELPDPLIGLVYATTPMQASRLDAEKAKLKNMFLSVLPEMIAVDFPRVSERHHSIYGDLGVDDEWAVMSMFNRM